VRSNLLHSLQALLERTYRMDTGIVDVSAFVIGDEGYRVLYGSGDGAASPAADVVGASGSAGAGARVLVREEAGSVAARIYYPDVLIRNLEECPPARGLTDANGLNPGRPARARTAAC